MKTFEKLQQVKEMITKLVACWVYLIFKNYYTMIAIDLSKQQTVAADVKSIQQINFTANLDRDGNTTMFFNIEEVKETILDFSQRIVKVF